ncbi:MAG TPA: hypothetical protein VKB95_10055, partial [Chitinophagaceae bacterium]|nr:hypothetical protein [Chitinophagaceae bacterium]
MSGFELTWAFFGYSKLYNSFIALSQITASIFLLFRRTTLLGAFMLLPIVANIVMIDYSFKILGPLPLAIMLLYMCLFLIAGSWKKLVALFINNQTAPAVNYSAHIKWNIFVRITAGIALLFYVFGFNYLKSTRIPPPSVLDGAWHSVKAINYSNELNNYRNFAKLFIESNYAVIKQPYGLSQYQLKLDTNNKATGMILDPVDSNAGKRIEGKYRLINFDSLIISGKQGGDSIQWILKRKMKQ